MEQIHSIRKLRERKKELRLKRLELENKLRKDWQELKVEVKPSSLLSGFTNPFSGQGGKIGKSVLKLVMSALVAKAGGKLWKNFFRKSWFPPLY